AGQRRLPRAGGRRSNRRHGTPPAGCFPLTDWEMHLTTESCVEERPHFFLRRFILAPTGRVACPLEPRLSLPLPVLLRPRPAPYIRAEGGSYSGLAGRVAESPEPVCRRFTRARVRPRPVPRTFVK